jgi:hypothetical protein
MRELLCTACADLPQQDEEFDGASSTTYESPASQNAKTRILWSWIIAGAAAALVLVIGTLSLVASLFSNDPNGPSFFAMLFGVPLGSLIVAYLCWSTYWGIPVVWAWWRKLFSEIGWSITATPLAMVILLVLFFYIPLFCGYMYGALGGAIYQYFKYRKIATGGAPLSSNEKKMLLGGVAAIAVCLIGLIGATAYTELRENQTRRQLLTQGQINNASGSTAERLGLMGTWVGTQNNRATSLTINNGNNNAFSGIKIQGAYQIAFTGQIDPNTHQISIQETRVLQGYNRWSLGTESGYLSDDSRQISGTGRDANTSYSWSYSKE